MRLLMTSARVHCRPLNPALDDLSVLASPSESSCAAAGSDKKLMLRPRSSREGQNLGQMMRVAWYVNKTSPQKLNLTASIIVHVFVQPEKSGMQQHRELCNNWRANICSG